MSISGCQIPVETIYISSSGEIEDQKNEEINAIPDLMNIYEGHNWKGKLNLIVYRNQEPMNLLLATKK